MMVNPFVGMDDSGRELWQGGKELASKISKVLIKKDRRVCQITIHAPNRSMYFSLVE